MKAFIAAEIGSNWEGSYTKAKKIIQECKKAGADAVKFQMWKAEELYDKSHPNWNKIKKAELSFQTAKKLKEFSDKQKIEFFCSAFYPDAVEFLTSIGVKKRFLSVLEWVAIKKEFQRCLRRIRLLFVIVSHIIL